MSERTDVLVVGAGPTGLTTALQALAHGANVRVVERRPHAFRPSRAMIVHPRTLECLRPLGVTDDLLANADISPKAELHLGHRQVSIELSGLDLPDTAFPHLTLLRQTDVETVLADALTRRGVTIERGVELIDAHVDHDSVRVTLRSAAGLRETTCRYVAGCDGPDSTVRSIAGIGWRGASYRQEVVLADVELAGDLDHGRLHVAAGRSGLLFVFALGEGATWRLLATRPTRGPQETGFGQPGRAVPAAELQQLIDASGLTATVDEVTWSAGIRLQHRLAASYRDRRLFLAGDAAHSQSPAGGLGMNTGILDAVNLGWKLAYAGDAQHDALLDSYDRERRPIARQVLAMTHLIFFAEASTHPLPVFLRGTVVPLAAPAVPVLMRHGRLLAEVIRTLSQLRVNYRGSALSQSGTPSASHQPRPGDRLPDATVECDGVPVRLHELTATPGIHVLLSRDAAELNSLGPRVTVHRLTSRPGPGVVAVRPDGYVGFRSGSVDAAAIRAWLELAGGRPG